MRAATAQAPINGAPKGPMEEAARILGCVIAMLDELLQGLNSGAAYGAQTLLIKAEKASLDAIVGRTTYLQEEASSAMHEALDVLQLVAQKLDAPTVWGVVTLTELAKAKLDATIGCFAEEQA
jgi:uncharacterized protein YbjQ (UPF0145 family)